MYNKSEIMKTAWATYRNKKLKKALKIETFAKALRYAWNLAKSNAAYTKVKASGIGYVRPEELNIGDTVTIANLAGYKTNKVVTVIEPAPLGFAGVTIQFNDGDIKCYANYEHIQRTAIAA